MIGMIGFNKYLLVIFERRIDWLQVWSEDLDTHRWKLPGSPADQNNVEHQRSKIKFIKYQCNRRQLNSSRKGLQDSHPRVQTVQAGRGPGGWTRRRALGCQSSVAGVPSRPRYGMSYQISTKSLILISQHCTDIMYDIKVFTFDILISRPELQLSQYNSSQLQG
jgi:hypothetical protein